MGFTEDFQSDLRQSEQLLGNLEQAWPKGEWHRKRLAFYLTRKPFQYFATLFLALLKIFVLLGARVCVYFVRSAEPLKVNWAGNAKCQAVESPVRHTCAPTFETLGRQPKYSKSAHGQTLEPIFCLCYIPLN